MNQCYYKFEQKVLLVYFLCIIKFTSKSKFTIWNRIYSEDLFNAHLLIWKKIKKKFKINGKFVECPFLFYLINICDEINYKYHILLIL